MPSSSDNVLDAAASDWIARRDRGLSIEEARELEAWLTVPRHAQAFAHCEAVWAALARINPIPAELPPARSVSPRRVGMVTASIALAVAASVVLGIFLTRPRSPSPAAISASATIVATTDGERIALPDGSIAFLRAGSRVRYAQTSSARRLQLEAGEVHVTVAKTSPLPFYVDTPDVVIRDIGTAFDVRLTADGVGITVTEGEVRLDAAKSAAPSATPVRLIRGQKAWVNHQSGTPEISVSAVSAESLPTVLAWKSRRLVFDRAPLTEVVRQINQFNVVQLVIADPSLAAKPIAGAVQSDNLEGIVHLLKTGFRIEAQTHGNEIRLVSAP